LSGEPAASEEETQGYTDIGSDEHLSPGFGKHEGQRQEDGVACLVRGEAVEVGEGDGV
jgi:hypothetical protein